MVAACPAAATAAAVVVVVDAERRRGRAGRRQALCALLLGPHLGLRPEVEEEHRKEDEAVGDSDDDQRDKHMEEVPARMKKKIS